MPAEWRPGAAGRVVKVDGNMGGCNFEAFSLNGGELFCPEDMEAYPDGRDALNRPMVAALHLKGPCVLVYLDGADAARFRALMHLPDPASIAKMGTTGGLILPGV